MKLHQLVEAGYSKLKAGIVPSLDGRCLFYDKIDTTYLENK